MYGDTSELAENKLLLLYIANEIKLPISNLQLTEIVLENDLLNYFTLQQYLFELISSHFLKSIEKDGKHRLVLSNKGLKVLSMFINRISPSKIKLIDEYLEKHINDIKKEITVTADYTIENNNFLVNLAATENGITLLDLKVNVGSNKQARDLCARWKENSSDIYTKIIEILIDENGEN